MGSAKLFLQLKIDKIHFFSNPGKDLYVAQELEKNNSFSYWSTNRLNNSLLLFAFIIIIVKQNYLCIFYHKIESLESLC